MFKQKCHLISSSKIWANFVGWVEERNPTINSKIFDSNVGWVEERNPTSSIWDRDRAQPNLRIYSGLQPYEVHLRLCSGTLKGARTLLSKPNGSTSLAGNPLYPKSKMALLAINLSAIIFLPAVTIAAPQPSAPPTNCPPLESGTNSPPAPIVPSGSVLTANTISQTGLTRPSLWWANEQFGNKLLNNWCAYPDERRIDLIVNRQIWSLLTYLERYAFVNHFGTVARDFQYNVRVFNQQNAQLATYTCNFSATPVSCNLQLDTTNIRSVGSRVR
jgi:hypothetical protein